MEKWATLFIIAATLVIILQGVMLALLYRQVAQTSRRMTQIAEDLHQKSDPILTKLRLLLDDLHPRLSSVAADSAEIAHMARNQVIRMDRVMAEAVDRLRLQIVRVDQLITGAIEHIEDAGSQVRKSVMGPVQQAAAIIQGVKAGLEVFRGQRRAPERARAHQDEELFI